MNVLVLTQSRSYVQQLAQRKRWGFRWNLTHPFPKCFLRARARTHTHNNMILLMSRVKWRRVPYPFHWIILYISTPYIYISPKWLMTHTIMSSQWTRNWILTVDAYYTRYTIWNNTRFQTRKYLKNSNWMTYTI